MTTTTILTKTQFLILEEKVGAIEHGNDYYDATKEIDCDKVRKKFGLKDKIKIIIMTESHKDFKNIANLDLSYKYPVFARSTYDGAYEAKTGSLKYWAVNNPVGDAFIITK
jgi:hypothetical protein